MPRGVLPQVDGAHGVTAPVEVITFTSIPLCASRVGKTDVEEEVDTEQDL